MQDQVVEKSFGEFDEHACHRIARRRAERVPTVAVVLGEPSAAIERLQISAATEGRPIIVFAAEPFARVVARWIERAIYGFGLIDRAGGSPRDAIIALDETIARSNAHGLLIRMLVQRQPTIDELSASLEAAQRERGILPESFIAVGVDLVGKSAVPGFVATAADFRELPLIASHAVRIAERNPDLEISVCTTIEAWTCWLESEREGHTRAVLNEAVFVLQATSTAIQPIDALVASRERARNDAARLHAIREPCADGAARSAVEQFAYELLQANPYTKDRFRLNERLPIRFGPADIEIDLLAREARIAIEIDGYHHFTDHEHYRRDRAKDRLLQRNGYFVARFLDTDIADEPAVFIATVIELILAKNSPGDRF